MAGVSDWLTRTTGYVYNAIGQPLTVTLANGVTTTIGYDAAERVITLTHQGLTQTLGVYRYGLDAIGNRLAVTETLLAPGAGVTSTQTITSQVSASTDDVNQDGSVLTTTAPTVWLGNGASITSSYTGLRFTNLSIPQGATITSAKLQVYSSQFQSLAIAMSITAEAIGNSPTFSGTNLPSQRTLTSHQVSHSSNTAWGVKTWYTLDEMAPVVQEVVNRGDWQSGNSLSIILKGTGGAYARKFVRSWDSDSAHAAELVITYTTGGGASTTAITYQYDSLSRLTSATYSTGAV